MASRTGFFGTAPLTVMELEEGEVAPEEEEETEETEEDVDILAPAPYAPVPYAPVPFSFAQPLASLFGSSAASAAVPSSFAPSPEEEEEEVFVPRRPTTRSVTEAEYERTSNIIPSQLALARRTQRLAAAGLLEEGIVVPPILPSISRSSSSLQRPSLLRPSSRSFRRLRPLRPQGPPTQQERRLQSESRLRRQQRQSQLEFQPIGPVETFLPAPPSTRTRSQQIVARLSRDFPSYEEALDYINYLQSQREQEEQYIDYLERFVPPSLQQDIETYSNFLVDTNRDFSRLGYEAALEDREEHISELVRNLIARQTELPEEKSERLERVRLQRQEVLREREEARLEDLRAAQERKQQQPQAFAQAYQRMAALEGVALPVEEEQPQLTGPFEQALPFQPLVPAPVYVSGGGSVAGGGGPPVTLLTVRRRARPATTVL